MPLDALAFALGAAALHAFWNVVLARERDVEAATALAVVSVLARARAAGRADLAGGG